jgi:hypothetical protein
MRTWTAMLVTITAWGQTQVDLQSQAKHVDFTNASATSPVKTGTALPAACTVGALFFLSNAASGANLYGCTASNVWTVQSSGGGSGAVTVDADGVLVGAQGTLNFVSGSGILNAFSNGGSQINIQHLADTAILQTQAREQSGATLLCASSGGSGTAYSCAMNQTLGVYTSGAVVRWIPDVNGAGGSTTLNIDTLGSVPIRLADGITDPVNADLLAGRMYILRYDGAVFRLVVPPVTVLAQGTQPPCNAAQRGRIWQTTGGSGVKDAVTVCAKDASDTFAWRIIF